MPKLDGIISRPKNNSKKLAAGKATPGGGALTGAADLTIADGLAASAISAIQGVPTDQEPAAELPPNTMRPSEGPTTVEPESHVPAPPVDAEAIEQLTAGLAAPDGNGPVEGRASETTNAPADLVWQAIVVGAVVLAQVSPAEGWWEARVTGALGNVLTLQWRDYPSYPALTRTRSEVALIYPETR